MVEKSDNDHQIASEREGEENQINHSKKECKSPVDSLENTLRISSLNIRRGLNDKEELLIQTIQEQSCDICSLSEVDIRDFDEKRPFSIKGFKTYFPLKRTGTNTKRLICFVKVSKG